MMTPEDSLSKVTIVFEAGENLDFLASKIAQAFYDNKPAPSKILVACPPLLKAQTLSKLSIILNRVRVLEVNSLAQDLPANIHTPFLAYLPANAPYCPPPMEGLEKPGLPACFIQPWVPPVSLPDTEWARLVYMAFGWISTPALLRQPFAGPRSLTLRDLENIIPQTEPALSYLAAPAGSSSSPLTTAENPARLAAQSRVLALVPHFDCLDWLGQCLDSLTRQTRPPDAIAVLDDASPVSPLGIVRQFPQVTLLKSPENVGPYRMIQSVIDRAGFDAYLFQDADDWSSLDRLEKLLGEAERTGAEWIGTQELTYFQDSIQALRYPLDLNAAPREGLRFPFCYASSLISGDFLKRLGGFATGLRFSGDFELLGRALLNGKVANLDQYADFQEDPPELPHFLRGDRHGQPGAQGSGFPN